jgi:hypothetical protein
MGWWLVVKAIVYIAATLYLRAKTPRPVNAQASGVSDFVVPTNDPTRAIPVVFGRCKIGGPTILWYGDFAATPVYKDKTIVKHIYQLGFDLGVCHGPGVVLKHIMFNDSNGLQGYIADRDGVLVYESRGPDVSISGSGSQSASEGRYGIVLFYPGSAHQVVDPYMTEQCGSSYPGYSHLCHVVLRGATALEFPGMIPSRIGTGFCVGTTESVETITVDVARFPNTLGLTGGQPQIGDNDANPICMIHEILTNNIWGLGLPASALDLDSFTAAAGALYDESFGLSMLVESPTEAADVITEILRHIDGELYSDPTTGKLVVKLVRADYDPDTLPVLDESCVSSVELSRNLETTNLVRVEYVNLENNFTPQIASVFDAANFNRTGRVSLLQASYRGITSELMADVVAARILLASSRPLAALKLTVNRKAWRLRPADVFKLNWPDYGITGMVCRVLRPAGGSLTDGVITIDCVEDCFGFTATDYSEPPGEGWSDPIGAPVAGVGDRLIELPYEMSPTPGRVVAALIGRASSGLIGFEIYADIVGGTAYVKYVNVLGYYVTGTLTAIYPATTAADDATGFAIANAVDGAALAAPTEDQLWHGMSLALIDDEIIGWRTVVVAGANLQIGGIVRGVYDTVPASHASGARVWFIVPGPESRLNSGQGMLADGTVAAKLLPYSVRSQLDITAAPRITVATASRASKPLPPGKVRLNGTAWPTSLVAGVDVVVTWAHRHRLDQATAGLVVSQDADDQAAAPEGNYTVQVLVGGALKRTVTAITGATWTWTAAMQTTDGATAGAAVTIRLIPVNGSLTGNMQIRGFALS